MAYDKLSSYKTAVFGEGNLTKIVYQRTAIVTFDRDSVTLRNGGWQTVTTKRKMNQASRQFGLGYSVFQKDFAWFVTLPNGATIPFMDGMTFERAELEEFDVQPKPFHVVGIDEEDGSSTILEQFDNSAEAREWMTRYASKENAGNWKRIEVLDTREECAETVASWEAAA